MRAFCLVGVLGLASAAGAETLPAATDVKAICDAVAPDAVGRRDAMAGTYAVTLPSTAFRLMPYDRARGRVAIDGGRGFRGDGWEMVLHGLVPGRVPAGALELAFPASAADGDELAVAHAAGRLTLVLTFQPAASDAVAPACARMHTVASDGVRLAVEPMAFELRRDAERIASGETARFAALRDEAAPGPVVTPKVVVQTAMRTSAGGRAPASMTKAASALTPRLLACYRQGLALEPTLRGSIVAGVDVGPDGRIAAARAEIDGLGAPAVTGCVLAEVRAAKFPRGPERLSIPIRFGSGE